MRDVWERFIWALVHSVGIDLFRRTRAWLTNGTCEEVEYGTASFFLIGPRKLLPRSIMCHVVRTVFSF
jgi:hypothetical protein